MRKTKSDDNSNYGDHITLTAFAKFHKKDIILLTDMPDLYSAIQVPGRDDSGRDGTQTPDNLPWVLALEVNNRLEHYDATKHRIARSSHNDLPIQMTSKRKRDGEEDAPRQVPEDVITNRETKPGAGPKGKVKPNSNRAKKAKTAKEGTYER